jgi:hypothetical protein
MRLSIGSISLGGGELPLNDKIGWRKCGGPKESTYTWIIAPSASIMLGVVFYYLINEFTELSLSLYASRYSIFIALFVIFVHELLHAIIHPDFGLSNKTIFGVAPKNFAIFTIYDDERSKINLLAGLIIPFLILSAAPLLVGIFSSYNNKTIGPTILMNAIFSGSDICKFLYILAFVPWGAKIKAFGAEAYWRKSFL